MRRHMSKDRLARLRTVPLFKGCDDKELELIDSLLDEVIAEPGRTLMEEGTAGREAFIVIDGEAEVLIGGARVAVVGPGAVIGEMAIVGHTMRTATVVATTAMKLLAADPRRFDSLLALGPVGHRVLETVVARLRQADEELDAVGSHR
ncbi:MAG: hypothetical protein NVS3B12_07610 [Acidimicrobiales bacterium]